MSIDPNNPFGGGAPTASPPKTPAKTLGSPPPPASSYSNAAYQQAGEHNPSAFGSIPAAAGKVNTLVGKALNYQLVHGPLKWITGKDTYEEQMPVYRHKLGLDMFYNANPDVHTGFPAIDRIVNPGAEFINGVENNLMDAAITLPVDPVTWETFGASAIGRTSAGLAARAFAARTLNRTMAGRAAFKALNWGGKATISRAETAHGGQMLPAIEEMEGVQGAGHQATAEGQRWAAHVDRRTNQIVNGINPQTGKKISGAALTDAEKKRVGQALNAEEEIPGEEGQYEEGQQQPRVIDTLSPKERSAYRQLRALTGMDWKTRQQAALSVALRGNIQDKALRDEVAQHFRSGTEPVVPEPGERIKTNYGEPQPRSRATYEKPQTSFVPAGGSQTRDTAKILFDQAVKDLGLNQFDKASLGKALSDDQRFARLKEDAPELYARAAQIREAIAHKYGRPLSVNELPEAPRYKMVPKNQAEIEHMTKVRDAYMRVLGLVSKTDEGGLMRYRKDYMPFAHRPAEGREAFTANPTEHVDMRNVERENMKVTGPKQLEEGFHAMAKNLGHQVKTKALNESLGSLLDDPEISKLFEEEIRATGGKRDDWGKAKDAIRVLVGWPRAALVGITPGHASNEIAMAMGTVPIERQPQFFAQSMSLAKKIFMAQSRGDEKEYFRLTAPGRSMGAGVGSFAERKPFFQKWDERIPLLGGKGTGPLGWWTKNMNSLVWSVSEAIRQNYAKLLLETGEAKTPLQAGGMAEKRLVDYQYRTPVQNFARHIAPFGTYRGGIPGAVLGGATRDLRRTAFLNRATGGAMYGDKPAPGQPGWEAFTPTAEVGRLFNYVPGSRFTESGPGDFLRASLSIPVAGAADAAQDVLAPSSAPKHWATYGQGWIPKRLPNGHLDLGFLFSSAIAGVPEAQSVLEANGISRYQWKGILQEIQRQFTRTQFTPHAAPAWSAPAAQFDPNNPFGGGTAPQALGTPPPATSGVNPNNPFGGASPSP